MNHFFSKFIFSIGLILLINSALQAQNNRYAFAVDLKKVKEDKLQVTLQTPTISKSEIVYCLPKIVPGTYSIYDFGRFATDFQAFDSKGKKLKVEQVDSNRWKIAKADKLAKIQYWIEDTFDSEKDNFVFEPAGTNIEEGKNFVINTFGFFGYFEGMKELPYELNFEKPAGFFGASSLKNTKMTADNDRFEAGNYMDLADAPIMFNQPDTTTLIVGGAKILISVYSPNKVLSAKFVGENITTTLNAQKDYLGGKLPIDNYAFIIYLFPNMSKSGSLGALEHSYSSMYSLPEAQPEYLTQVIRDVAAHEFFHIVTPLNIHSEEIHYFDFIEPKMSKHLWLYEGVTEYFASHVQVKSGLYGLEKYIYVLKEKMNNASNFRQDLTFTDLSSQCLKETVDQYGNVYEKGALIGLCLDLKLHKLSNGKYSLRQLMTDLSKEYGKEKPFKDEELFDKITKVTGFPEIRQFFTDHVEGTKPLPFKEVLGSVGISFDEEKESKRFGLGNVGLGLDESKTSLIIEDNSEMGKEMGYKVNDRLVKINGKAVDLQTAQELIVDVLQNAKDDDILIVEVERTVDGKKTQIELKGKMKGTPDVEKFAMKADPNATPEQVALRKIWLR